jgi:alkylation response protein AidB-like acyl-CoA dehydrogenase
MQLHGGIAFTWEHDVHLFLKRARSNQSLAGGSDRRAAALAASLMSSGESVLVMLGLEESTRPH